MKTPLMLAFLLLCGIAPLLHAASSDSLELILNESLAVSPEPSKVMATLERKISQRSTIFVIGKARSLKMADNEYIVQCVWSHLGAVGPQKSSVKALRKPLTSTYKTRGTILEKGLKLRAKGPQKLFWEDMEALFNKGSTNERPGQADIILNDQRHVEGEHPPRGGRKRGLGSSPLSMPYETKGTFVSQEGQGALSSSYPSLTPEAQQNTGGEPSPSHSAMRSGGGLSSARQGSRGPTAGMVGASMSGAGALPIGNNFVTAGQNNHPNRALDDIQVTITKEGCTPRIDEARGLVIIQVKAITRKNGTITETSACRDSHQTYPIKKDYLCAQCMDHIDGPNKVSYSRFRKYWIDEEGAEHPLSNQLSIDRDKPYPHILEKGWCTPEVDIASMQAYPRAEIVYYNRFNSRQVVKACNRIEAGGAPIVLTAEGCAPLHDFQGNRSKDRKRAVFTLDNVEHIALPCHEVGEWLNHEFITQSCRPLVDPEARTIIQTARRRIQTSMGPQFITQECEPYGNAIALQQTREGCEGLYIHDFGNGRSYMAARWYHTLKGYPKYVTNCIRGNEALDHRVEIKGYVHDDNALCSKPITAIFIETPQGRQEIDAARIREGSAPMAYILITEKETPSQTRRPYVENYRTMTPYDKIKVFKRPDGTMCEKVIGPGKIEQGPNPFYMEEID